MKRLIILLAGFGVFLLAGYWQDCRAQMIASILTGAAQVTDSSETLSLQERAEKNFTYIKGGPADAGKVTGELLAGSLGAAVGGVMAARTGFSIGSEGSGGCLGCFDEGGFIGALIGFMIGSNVGAATGVYVVGNSGGEKGSYWAGLGGSLLGTVFGGLCAAAVARDPDDESGALPLLVLSAAQAGGATLCFNATRKQRVQVPSSSMLNLKVGNGFNSDCYKLNLFQANF
jgi:hypothetical protein